MKVFYKLLLTVNSMMLLVVIYLIKEKITITSCKKVPDAMSYILYFLITLLFSAFCLWMSKWLQHDSIEGGITEVEDANNSYLPSYLGYFFVALSVNNDVTLFWVFITLLVFTFNSQTLYFNPNFLFFGYSFYYVTIETGMKIFIISKRSDIKTVDNLKFDTLRRINNFTFIDGRKY